MKQRIAIISILIYVINSSTCLHSQALHNFYKSDYRASSQNWSVKCDDTDYIYFGNTSGLLQFDGINWQLYPSANASIIRAVAHDSARIYTGGYREIGYWERNETGQLQYSSLTDSIKDQFDTNEEFWNIFVNGKQVMFHSFAGIYIYEDNAFNIIKPGGFINFATQSGNDVYVAIHNDGLYRLSNKQLILISDHPFIKSNYLRFISKTPQPDEYYIGTESNGLYYFNSRTGEFKPVAKALQNFFIKNKINHGLISPSGDIVIGTILDGIIGFSNDGVVKFHYNNDNGLQSNTVLGIDQDNFNNIWLALDKGIDLITLNNDLSYTTYNEEELGAVYSAALYNDYLYLGTNQGLYTRKWENANDPFTLVDNTQGQVWDCSTIDKTLFIGLNSGTMTNDGTGFKHLSGFAGAYTIKRHPYYHDILIQGTYNDLIIYKQSSQGWQFSNIIKGFNNLTRFIEFDHQGNLWATHFYGGLHKIRLNDDLTAVESLVHYDQIGSELQNRGHIRAFKVENQIVITSGKELYTYDDLNDKIVPYTLLNKAVGIYKNAIRIVEGTNHHYWFISSEGLAYYKIYADDIELIREYPSSIFENHLIPQHENIVQINDSLALVCMENGYSLLNLNGQSYTDTISWFQPELQQATAYNRKAESNLLPLTNENIELPHSLNNIHLRYSFPVINGEKLKYQYIVEGLTDTWSELSASPTIELSRIPSGDYTIRIRAVNHWNKDSGMQVVQLKILDPWYRNNVALLMYLLMFIGLMLFLKHITSRKIKLKEKRKREDKEKELIQLKNEKLSNELSFKSQKLASSAMSIIKKNEFLLSLKAKIKKQKETLGNRYPDKYYQDLISKIDSNISGQDDWQLFEANFEQAHETFLKTMKATYPDLTSSDLRLCAYLRINLTSKDIAPLLGITVRGVENHRYRLRKKLGLSAEDNLIDFILSK
ncbi:triple tyrosine motif-containing protein [Carboxylicivirga sp. RSCT41]|uniref:helix-turn-helix and ligand-binding sensor domain-containing protein n=1 Tax=Carboxylicivirga agarovorans TaxID=3417570 RepID=UPI003D32DE22